ncbi:MAG: ABC transporter ATP-binding protein [Hyphomicrobiaceae bacterium]
MNMEASAIRARLGNRDVLKSVSFVATAGRITGLLGPNGAGKTTLLRCLAGLVPLTAGTAQIDGRSIAAFSRAELGRHLAFLPQDRQVHWPVRVSSLVALGRMPHHPVTATAGPSDAAAIASALADMDVAHLADRHTDALSGGELARVLFARALAQQAPVILADEPTAGLDPAHALGLFQVLRRLAAAGRTIVIALHDLSLAARFCDDVALLKDGETLGSGPAAEVLVPERLGDVFDARMAVGTIRGVPAIVPLDSGL